VAPEGRRPEKVRQVQVALLEQAEASEEVKDMTPETPQLTTHDMVSCAQLAFSPSSFIIVLADLPLGTSEEALT
jgi:hypothetical protein